MAASSEAPEGTAGLSPRAQVPGTVVLARVPPIPGEADSPVALSFGTADAAGERPVNQDTVFHLYSGTKLYTAAALMTLVEDGALDLDQAVNDVLPELPLRRPVTLRHLASHSSGLPDTLRAFMAVHLEGEPAPTTAEALSRYATAKGRAPGKGAAYRNVNYAILGEVIARASGMSYERYVTERVLVPLGSRARFAYDEDLLRDAAEGTIRYWSPMRWLLRLVMPGLLSRVEGERSGSLVALQDFSLDTAAIGGLVGRARDFLPLAVEMLSPEDGVLRAETKSTMLSLHAHGRAGIASKVGVGIGWKFGVYDGVPFWNHEGGGPGFTSETRIYPNDQTAVVVLMNATQSSKLSWVANGICEAVRAGGVRLG